MTEHEHHTKNTPEKKPGQTASFSHFCGKRDGKAKILKWRLLRQIKPNKRYEQIKLDGGSKAKVEKY